MFFGDRSIFWVIVTFLISGSDVTFPAQLAETHWVGPPWSSQNRWLYWCVPDLFTVLESFSEGEQFNVWKKRTSKKSHQSKLARPFTHYAGRRLSQILSTFGAWGWVMFGYHQWHNLPEEQKLEARNERRGGWCSSGGGGWSCASQTFRFVLHSD